MLSTKNLSKPVLTEVSSIPITNTVNSDTLPNTSTNMRQKIEQAIENDNIANITVKSTNQVSNDYSIDKKSAKKIVEQKDKLDNINDKLENIEDKIEITKEHDSQNNQKIKKLQEKRRSLISKLKNIYILVDKLVDKKIISPLQSVFNNIDTIAVNENFLKKPARAKKDYYFQVFSGIVLLAVFRGFSKLIQGHTQRDKHDENNAPVSIDDKNPSKYS